MRWNTKLNKGFWLLMLATVLLLLILWNKETILSVLASFGCK